MEIFNTIIGSAAEGKVYFKRPYLNIRLWKYLRNGSHVLVSAPRRIGKTSFLINICHNGKEDYLTKYHITQSVNSSNEFFKRLYKSVLEELTTKANIWESLTDIIRKNKIEKIGMDGIELKGSDVNYFEEFKRLIAKIELDQKLVFVVDEFSETVENIINDQGDDAGRLFLHQNRELRQDRVISSKIQFIYCGSIGLGNIAERINSIKNINDLTNFQMPPFEEEEALSMMTQLTLHQQLDFDEARQKYLLSKVHWLIPYYIQIILDEIENILIKTGSLLVTEEIIDKAMAEALKKRDYFEHWHTRLRTAFQGKEYTFAKEVLNAVSKAETEVSKTQIFDISQGLEVGENFTVILRTLEYDGYVHQTEEGKFLFNSPLLKVWWKKNIAI